MKTLTCKMCGSTYLIKEDSMYLCQSCGTKYSIADIEGENIPKNIEIDPEILKQEAERQEELKRLRVLVKDDYSLYERIQELDPEDWESYYRLKVPKTERLLSAYDLAETYLTWLENNLLNIFDLLKNRISSDYERQKCIKKVIFEDFKNSLNLFMIQISCSSLRESVDSAIMSSNAYIRNGIAVFENRILASFGESYSDFINTLKKETNELSIEIHNKAIVAKKNIRKNNIKIFLLLLLFMLPIIYLFYFL